MDAARCVFFPEPVAFTALDRLDGKTHVDILKWHPKVVAFAIIDGYAYVTMHPEVAAQAAPQLIQT
jgi:hypothetical protein